MIVLAWIGWVASLIILCITLLRIIVLWYDPLQNKLGEFLWIIFSIVGVIFSGSYIWGWF
jgi:hypothetical protein